MKRLLVLPLLAAAALAADPIPNPRIDYDKFLADAVRVGELRKQRRVTEADFIRMSSEPGTVVLDARSAAMFRLLHVKGAVNLSLPDMNEADLAKVIPAKSTRVLIYCNNNFRNEPVAFAAKAPSSSLNLNTFNTLFSYGYTNVYELGPLLDVDRTKLALEGERKPAAR